MKKTPKIEGLLPECTGTKCEHRCCVSYHGEQGGVTVWKNEWQLLSPIADQINSVGIQLKEIGDRVKVTECSTGIECKFMQLDTSIDYRPIDCKIYPLCVDWHLVSVLNKKVTLKLWDTGCPIAYKLPETFIETAKQIIKRDFKILFGIDFEVDVDLSPDSNGWESLREVAEIVKKGDG